MLCARYSGGVLRYTETDLEDYNCKKTHIICDPTLSASDFDMPAVHIDTVFDLVGSTDRVYAMTTPNMDRQTAIRMMQLNSELLKRFRLPGVPSSEMVYDLSMELKMEVEKNFDSMIKTSEMTTELDVFKATVTTLSSYFIKMPSFRKTSDADAISFIISIERVTFNDLIFPDFNLDGDTADKDVIEPYMDKFKNYIYDRMHINDVYAFIRLHFKTDDQSELDKHCRTLFKCI